MAKAKAKPKAKAPARAARVPICAPKALPADLHVEAAAQAVAINPANEPVREGLGSLLREVVGRIRGRIEALKARGPGKYELLPMPAEVIEDTDVMDPGFLATLTSKYWGAKGVRLSVAFLDSPGNDLANRIIGHLNAWGTVAGANVEFVRSTTDPQVRITRSGQGYWSYIGTDIKMIPKNQPTMCLQAFTMKTPEAEFCRVVRHEAGHTLGFPHEHAREDIVNQLDEQKTIAYFMRTQGWSAQQVRQQILTPVPESALLDPTTADELSIMTYQFPGACTLDGEPIPGGYDINDIDAAYARKVYPRDYEPPPEGGSAEKKVITVTGKDLVVRVS